MVFFPLQRDGVGNDADYDDYNYYSHEKAGEETEGFGAVEAVHCVTSKRVASALYTDFLFLGQEPDTCQRKKARS